MFTPFGDLPPGSHQFGDVTVVVNEKETGFTESMANIPRSLWPFEFISLLTDDQLTGIYTSDNPAVIRMATQVQTIVSPIPFDDGSPLCLGVQALGLLMPNLFTADEVTRILAGVPPE